MRRVVILVSLIAFGPAGCGTVANLKSGGPPYGGVCEAARTGARCAARAGQGHCIPPAFDWTAAAYNYAIDLPLSAVGDTVTLPITVLTHRTEARDTESPITTSAVGAPGVALPPAARTCYDTPPL
jgi:uncharacterized protein YceK